MVASYEDAITTLGSCPALAELYNRLMGEAHRRVVAKVINGQDAPGIEDWIEERTGEVAWSMVLELVHSNYLRDYDTGATDDVALEHWLWQNDHRYRRAHHD